MKLIDKDALVAEIKRRLEEYRTYPDYQIDSNYMELCEILSFINTLEVKEVDLEKAKNVIRDTLNGVTRLGSLCTDDIIEHAVDDLAIALGLKAKQG